MHFLTQEWTAVYATKRGAIRRKAEEHAYDNAGPKMIQVSLALDRLLDSVADMAKDMRDEGTKATHRKGLLLVGGSFFIASRIYFGLGSAEGPPVRLAFRRSLRSIPATTLSRFHWPVTSHARQCVRSSSLLGHLIRVSP